MLLLPPLGHPVQEHDSRELRHPAHLSASDTDGLGLTLPLAMRKGSRPLKPHFLEVGSQMESLPDRALCLLSGGTKSGKKLIIYWREIFFFKSFLFSY